MRQSENILGYLREVNGYTYDIVYDLIFTSDRLVAAVIQHPVDSLPSQISPSLTSLIFGAWLDRRNQQIEQRTVARERRKAMKNASSQELLEQNPLNFAIPYCDISSAKVNRSVFDWQLKFSFLDSSTYKMASFTLHKNQVLEGRRLLELALGTNKIDK